MLFLAIIKLLKQICGTQNHFSFQFVARGSSFHRMWTLMFETPGLKVLNNSRLNNFFNWTMAYRMDSDLPAPAGRILHINKELVHVDHKHMIGWNHLDGIQSLSSEGNSFVFRFQLVSRSLAKTFILRYVIRYNLASTLNPNRNAT